MGQDNSYYNPNQSHRKHGGSGGGFGSATSDSTAENRVVPDGHVDDVDVGALPQYLFGPDIQHI